jgi:hypothetical protein
MTVAAVALRVTPDGPRDGGDFGPYTPGTRTAGIQEALDEAHRGCHELHIVGGRGGLHDGEGTSGNVYQVEETIRVPWSQDFTLTGGNYVLSYTGSSGSALHIDSQMNCRYHFGLVVSRSPDPVVLIHPESEGPDDFVVVTASVLDFACAVSSHPEGTSICLDSSCGPIVNCRLFAEETNSQGTGLHLTDDSGRGQWISNNSIEIMYGNQYHGTDQTTGLRLGDPGSQRIVHNRLTQSFHAPRGAHFDERTKRYVLGDDVPLQRAVGAEIHAQENELHLSFYGRRPAGQDVVFEADSRDNTVFALNLPNGVTSHARVPTNRVVSNRAVGFDVVTPAVPLSGEPVVNDTAFTVQALILDPGAVSGWVLADAGAGPPRLPGNLSLVDNLRGTPPPEGHPRKALAQPVPGGLHAGQSILLEPGDAVSFDYTEAPAWRWKALR